MMRLLTGMTLVLLAMPLGAQQAPARLVRCVADSYTPCLASTVRVSRDEAAGLARLDAAVLERAWRARFGADSLAVIVRRGVLTDAVPIRLLLLVDVSGSMRKTPGSDPIGLVRASLSAFLREVSAPAAGTVRVSVVPFGSIGVDRNISAARFTTPDSARAQVDGFPEPYSEDTGLYSAIDLGLDRLDAELLAAPDGTIGGLIVITDGNNDVGRSPLNDADLIPDAGFPEVRNALANSSHAVWLIGLGNSINPHVLPQLAGTRGKSYSIGINSTELARTLREIGNSLWTAWEINLPLLSLSRAELARGFALARVSVRAGNLEAQHGIPWLPPRIAFPVFTGSIDSLAMPHGLRETLASDAPADRRLIVFGVLALFGALLWFWVPRRLWALAPPIAPGAAAGVPPAPTRAAKPVPVPAGGLRRDVQEAPPRQPTDATGEHARYTGVPG
jgi:hypothetical protein